MLQRCTEVCQYTRESAPIVARLEPSPPGILSAVRPVSSSVVTTVTGTAGRLAASLHQSVRRARLEGERRVLQRQHRAAVEALGTRVVLLVRDGTLEGAPIGPEVATVEAKLMEIDAKTAEIEGLGIPLPDAEAAQEPS